MRLRGAEAPLFHGAVWRSGRWRFAHDHKMVDSVAASVELIVANRGGIVQAIG
jgi:hypothetical protein